MDNFLGIGGWELMVIGLIALIILGPKQMILLARKAGEYLRQFQQIWQEASKTLDKEIKAIESEAGSLGDLGHEIQNLERELKAAVNKTISLEGIPNPPSPQANTIQPPPSPAPPIPATSPVPAPIGAPPGIPATGPTQRGTGSAATPQPPGFPAQPPWSAGAAASGQPPGTTQPAKTPTKYPAWTSRPDP